MELDFLKKHYPDKRITVHTNEHGCAFAEIETEDEPVTVWYDAKDPQPYMVCFAYQHCHCFTENQVLDETDAYISGEKACIEFFVGERRCFGGDIDAVLPEHFTSEHLKSTWVSDHILSRELPESLICKVRSVKKEFCFDAEIGTDGSVTVYDKSGENT